MITDEHDDEWATYAEAARRFNLSESTIRSWVRREVIHPDDVRRWKGRVVGLRVEAVSRAEVHLWRHGPKLAAGHKRGRPAKQRSDVQQ